MASMDNTNAEYDQNAILAELDRVLRSLNLAERCEIIIKLPQQFDKHPFPVFITSVFHKLVEAFRSGTNLSRKWILYVAEHSKKHLDKIISPDELMKIILTVSHSNDPNARALTMKLFAYFARILADRKQMHHLISTSLDSNDQGELLAAVFAAQRFAEESPEFGRSIFDKVTEMLLSIDVPPETKLRLVPVFQYFHSDPDTSQKAVMFCRDQLLPQCHSSALIGSILSALTTLAVRAVVVASAQLSLLLRHLDSRRVSKRVVATALDCLHFMARQTPHLWTADAIKILCDVCEGSDMAASMRALRVLATLTRSQVVRLWSDNEVARIFDLCSMRCYSNDNSILATSCRLATNMTDNLGPAEQRSRFSNTLKLALMAAIPIWPWNSDNDRIAKDGKNLLKCVLASCKNDTDTAQALAPSLLSVVGLCSEQNGRAVRECLLALCDLDSMVAESLQILINRTGVEDVRLGISLRLTPKTSAASLARTFFTADELDAVCGNDYWHQFLVGRRALRYGYVHVAKVIFDQLRYETNTDLNCQWIKSLAQMSTGESCLQGDRSSLDRLATATNNHQLALIHMKAAAASSSVLWFPVTFLQHRLEFLNISKELRTMWNVSVLIPPSNTASGDGARNRLIEQFTRIEKRLDELGSAYHSLTRKCFDADDFTIHLLKLLGLKCLLMQKAIGTLIGKNEGTPVAIPSSNLNAQTRILSKHLEWMRKEVENMRIRFDASSKQAVEYALAIVDHLCFEIPFFIPRFFFQSLQTCNVKLSLTPKPSDRDHTFKLPSDQRLLLNVEGVVTVSRPGGSEGRKVERVHLTVSTRGSGGGMNVMHDGKPRSNSTEFRKLEKTVALRNDYFSADFVLDFTSSGTVDVNVELVDDRDGFVWDGNAEEHLKVKLLPVQGSGESSSMAPRSHSVSVRN